MDQTQRDLLTKTEPYIQNNLTVNEFLDRIEPMIPRDASRRLRAVLAGKLHNLMPE